MAFDLYRHLGGHYATRWVQKLVWIPWFLYVYANGVDHIVRQDPAFKGRGAGPFSLSFWRQWHRAAKAGFLPGIGWFLKEELRYLKPGYEPVNEADTADALAYMAHSEGVRAGAAAGGRWQARCGP